MGGVRDFAAARGRAMVSIRGEVDGTCAICLGEMLGRPQYHLPCAHDFHKRCFLGWKQSTCRNHLLCPVCRRWSGQRPRGVDATLVRLFRAIAGIVDPTDERELFTTMLREFEEMDG